MIRPAGPSGSRPTSLRTFRDVGQCRRRIFCFPFAGGVASVFRPWATAFPGDTELHAAQYPGRQDRISEPPARDFDELLGQLWADLDGYLDQPFALFGHSMGAQLAFELALRCQQLRQRPPAHLFLSAARPPHLADRPGPLDTGTGEQFPAAVERLFGPLPAELAAGSDLAGLVLDLLATDLGILATYRPRSALAGLRLTCPVTVFAAADDATVSPEQMLRWRDTTSGSFACHHVPGQHLYIRDGWRPVAAVIASALRA